MEGIGNLRRVRLVVAYDGTNYHGWQYQPNAVTIEEVLNKALTELLREPIAVIGAQPHGRRGCTRREMWRCSTQRTAWRRTRSVWR